MMMRFTALEDALCMACTCSSEMRYLDFRYAEKSGCATVAKCAKQAEQRRLEGAVHLVVGAPFVFLQVQILFGQ